MHALVSHDDFEELAFAKPGVKKAFDELEDEFRLLDEILRARKAAGVNQEQAAALMGAKRSLISRIESSLGKKNYTPSLATLRKYAKALGCRLEIRFVPA